MIKTEKWYKGKLIILILGIIVLYLIPLEYVESRSFCIFNNLWDIECLGCGFSRAFFNLTRLNILEAINYNKMIIFLGPVFIGIICYEIIHAIKSIKKLNEKSIIDKIILACFYK